MTSFRRHKERDQARFGRDVEKKIAKREGFSLTTASGSKAEKGDLRRGDFAIESKATRAGSFRVTEELIATIRNDSLTQGKDGVLIVTLGSGRQVAIMELDTFERLTCP